jgi:histidyl-tRNA synthetase
MNIRAPEGTRDLTPEQTPTWQRLEAAARGCFARFGYEEIRTPVFEQEALFHKTSGETTDIVEKEMFKFADSEGTGFALRPELTPGTIRALIEQNLLSKRNFWKVWYLGPAFRKERPQKGRYRQFTQIGVEAVGASDPLLDAETMILFAEILRSAGVNAWELRINSIGCGACRGGFRDALREAIRPDLQKYCENCRRRFDRNVFRVLDCKVPGCAALSEKLPPASSHACAACREHQAAVEAGLRSADLPYRVDPRIVRGLDYYTRTVYEFSSSTLGAQNALAGGGRYDTLVRDMGGPDVGAVGFAAGMERILLAMGEDVPPPAPDVFVMAVAGVSRTEVFRVLNGLRRAGLSGDMDFEGRSLKAQMRTANRCGARHALLIGPDELQQGAGKLKDMKEGSERIVPLVKVAEILKGEGA